MGRTTQEYYQKLYTSKEQTGAATGAKGQALSYINELIGQMQDCLKAPLTLGELYEAMMAMRPGKS